MDSLLKNFGLSDTRFQLKFQTPKKLKKTYQQKHFTKPIKSQFKASKQQVLFEQKRMDKYLNKQKRSNKQQQHSFTQKKIEKDEQNFKNKTSQIDLAKNAQKQTLIIEEMIKLLQSFSKQKCFLKGHQYNLKKFVCLQENCKNKIGCSYCFLHEHKSHIKSQAQVCIKDLVDLKQKIDMNHQNMSKKAGLFKKQFKKQIQNQIKFIRAQFQANISFLQKKIIQFVQSFVDSKYDFFLNDKIQKYDQQQKNIANQDFNETVKLSALKSKFRSQFNQSSLKQNQKQKKLLHHLSILDFQQVENYLQARLKEVDIQTKESHIFVQFFQQMNSSISLFFSAFKKNIPKVSYNNFNIKCPLVLNKFDLT